MLKTTIIYFVGSFASKLLTFFLLPLYTAYLSPDEFGMVDLLISVVPLIGPIFTIQTTESIFRFLFEKKTDEEKAKSITSSLFILIIGILCFCLFYTPVALHYHFRFKVLFAIYFIVIYLGFFTQQIARGLQKNLDYAVAGVLTTVTQAAINILLIVKFNVLGESLLVAAIVAAVLSSLYLALRTKLFCLIKLSLISRAEIKAQIRYGLPLVPNQICWWALGIFGKYLLLYYVGAESNGIWALAMKFPNLLNVISSIFFLAWTENVIIKYSAAENGRYYSDSFRVYAPVMITGIAILLPVTKLYNVITIGANYAEAILYIPFLYIAAIFNSFATFLGSIYTASMKTRDAFNTTFFAAVVNVAASFLLTPGLGMWGIAGANVLSYFCFFLIRVRSVKRLVGFNLFARDYLAPVAMLTLAIILYYQDSIALEAASTMFFVGVFFCINRGFAKLLLRQFGELIRRKN